MKKYITILLALIISLMSAFASFADANYVYSGPGAAKWEQQANGEWKYKKGDGYVVNDWVDVDGETYLLDRLLGGAVEQIPSSCLPIMAARAKAPEPGTLLPKRSINKLEQSE